MASNGLLKSILDWLEHQDERLQRQEACLDYLGSELNRKSDVFNEVLRSRLQCLEDDMRHMQNRLQEILIQQSTQDVALQVSTAVVSRHQEGHAAKDRQVVRAREVGGDESPGTTQTTPDHQNDDEHTKVEESSPSSSSTKRGSISMLSVVEQQALKFVSHQIAENVWEAAIFVHLPSVHSADSVMLVISLLLNILLQITFVFVVIQSFLTHALPTVEDVWAWREMQGHQAVNLQTASGTSLVAAICSDDPTLIVADSWISLYNSITEYTDKQLGVSSGFMLCTMILIQWILIVGQECRQIISYAFAVMSLPAHGRRTKLGVGEGGIVFTSCSIERQTFALSLCAARLGIAVVLLISGSIWLAQTIEVQDLVLNAAALATLMETDEVVFASLTSLHVKTVVREFQALKRPRGFQFKGISAAPTHLLVSIIVVVWFITQHVIPNIEKMDQIEAALCGGFRDFVVQPSLLSVILVTGTNSPKGQSETESYARQAVSNMISKASIDDAWQVLELFYLVKPQDFNSFLRYDLDKQVSFLTSQVLGTDCEDYDFAAVGAVPSFKTCMAYHFQAESCADIVNHCTGDWRFLRMLCPVTCGCSSPYSGLYKNGPGQGCPNEACLASPAYIGQLSRTPCIDYNISDLVQMTGWTNFVSQWEDTWTTGQPRLADDIQQAGLALMSYGCAVFNFLPLRTRRMLCQSGTEFGSLNPYCPVSCSCMDLNRADEECPLQCLSMRNLTSL